MGLHPRRGVLIGLNGWVEQIADPLLALGTIWLFVTAMRSRIHCAGMEVHRIVGTVGGWVRL
jgi:hypothetical protein